MTIQTKEFDHYDINCIENMNKFMKDINVVDVKMNTVIAPTDAFFTRYLVIYKETEND